MRMTLDDTWKNCLSMWRWIAKEVRKSKGWKYLTEQQQYNKVDDLKAKWLLDNGFEGIEHDCFFCNHAQMYHKLGEYVRGAGCRLCPAIKIDSEFDCLGGGVRFDRDPVDFCKWLVSLNRKRLKAKRA